MLSWMSVCAGLHHSWPGYLSSATGTRACYSGATPWWPGGPRPYSSDDVRGDATVLRVAARARLMVLSWLRVVLVVALMAPARHRGSKQTSPKSERAQASTAQESLTHQLLRGSMTLPQIRMPRLVPVSEVVNVPVDAWSWPYNHICSQTFTQPGKYA